MATAVLHQRSIEGEIVSLAEGAEGHLSPRLVKSIALEYSVFRSREDFGVSNQFGVEEVFSKIADEINQVKLTGTLKARSDRAIALARRMKKDLDLTKKIEISGVTKLMWFRSPRDSVWPIFDSLAAHAVGAKGEKRVDVARDFYDELISRGYSDIAERAPAELTDLSGCRIDRVLDQFLVFCCADHFKISKEAALFATRPDWCEVDEVAVKTKDYAIGEASKLLKKPKKPRASKLANALDEIRKSYR